MDAANWDAFVILRIFLKVRKVFPALINTSRFDFAQSTKTS